MHELWQGTGRSYNGAGGDNFGTERNQEVEKFEEEITDFSTSFCLPDFINN